MYEQFLQEIMSGKLPVTSEGLNAYKRYIYNVLNAVEIKDKKQALKAAYFNFEGKEIGNFTEEEDKEAVMVIPIRGMLTKYGSWWDYGTEDYADLIQEGLSNEQVKSIVLQIHTPGGTTHSVIPFENVLKKNHEKKVVAMIDSLCMSAGMYIASLCDRVYAVDRMAEVGSIGIMSQIVDNRKMYEEYGIQIITVIPPESKWKNRAFFEARDGKPDLLIKEELSPWAIHFQNIVKENRPELNQEVEGILEGRQFYAYDALKHGLIDAIMPMEELIDYLAKFEENEALKKLKF